MARPPRSLSQVPPSPHQPADVSNGTAPAADVPAPAAPAPAGLITPAHPDAETRFGGFDITEKRLWHLAGGPAALILLLVLVLIVGPFAVLVASGDDDTFGFVYVGLSLFVLIVALIALTGFSIIQPGHTLVSQFFGKYVGTIRTDGLIFTYPLTVRKKLSVRVRNFETNELKINDEDGNPVTTAAIIVWTVGDTARASFAVKDYEAFIQTQAEAALRHVISTHPYDEGNRTDIVSLRGSTDEVSQELADEVAARVQSAGLTIIEARISSLAYAPEIAQAMLQRQQAAAVVAARERIVDGAVSMVQDALQRLEANDIVELDDERRAVMVSNLLVVLCSDNRVSPVVNTGTLYN